MSQRLRRRYRHPGIILAILLSMTDRLLSRKIILLAKQRHIEELQALTSCTGLIETLGFIVHQLQAERGASCLYLAANGKRFAQERSQLILQNESLSNKFNALLQQYLDDVLTINAKQLILISWILLGLEEIASFRHQVTLMKVSFSDCIQSYTRLIGSLISLIFEITDSAANSKLSSHLVALYHLVQGKEFAGQERAVGSYMYASGSVDLLHQQRVGDLIDLQDRHFEAFAQFATNAQKQNWLAILANPNSHQHQCYRNKLINKKATQTLKEHESTRWFDVCSQRLTDIWELQCQLIHDMHQMLENDIINAQTDLESTRTYLHNLTGNIHQKSELDNTFFNLAIPLENAFSFLSDEKFQAYPLESIISLLQAQSQQIAKIENELFNTKKALAERKQIERAKGIIMMKMEVSEADAYKVLRNTAMEQNRKIIEVAENILSLAIKTP